MVRDISERIEEEMRGGKGVDMERISVTQEVLREALAGEYSVELVVRVPEDKVIRYPVVLEYLHLGDRLGFRPGFHAGIASVLPPRVEWDERKEGEDAAR